MWLASDRLVAGVSREGGVLRRDQVWQPIQAQGVCFSLTRGLSLLSSGGVSGEGALAFWETVLGRGAYTFCINQNCIPVCDLGHGIA
jgi:hypothetical protein